MLSRNQKVRLLEKASQSLVYKNVTYIQNKKHAQKTRSLKVVVRRNLQSLSLRAQRSNLKRSDVLGEHKKKIATAFGPPKKHVHSWAKNGHLFLLYTGRLAAAGLAMTQCSYRSANTSTFHHKFDPPSILTVYYTIKLVICKVNSEKSP